MKLKAVNLTACLGASLTDTLFALDEPTIGLHGSDINKLVSILRSLANAGNCVCVVEHDEKIINAADKVIEIGPLPGKKGGRISFNGSSFQLQDQKTRLLPNGLLIINYQIIYLLKKESLGKKIQSYLSRCIKHNIKNFSASLPLSKLVCIAGVSGSGKSTLLNEIIYEEMKISSQSKFVKVIFVSMKFY